MENILTPALAKKYRLERLLGEGAFAKVYLATHLGLGVPRALKILHRDFPGVGSSDFYSYQQRFQLEARLGAELDHPNLVRVYDYEAEGDVLVLVMEYAAGGSLAERLAKARHEKQPLAIEECLQIAREVAAGLAALHERDIVHRDLKPSNILFAEKGRAKVADLGLAQVPGGTSLRSQLSQPLPQPGTPGYMSPEQENNANYLRPSSDVYSLGVILFEMLTLRNYTNLKPGTSVGSLREGVPSWLAALLQEMLNPDYRQRPWDGREVGSKLKGTAINSLERQKALQIILPSEADDQYEEIRIVPPEQSSPMNQRIRRKSTQSHLNKGLCKQSKNLIVLGQILQPINTQNAEKITQIACLGKGKVTDLAYSGNGLLAVSTTKGVQLYKGENPKENYFLDTEEAIERISFSPDGKLLALLSLRRVQVWSVDDKKLLEVHCPDLSLLRSVSFSPNGEILAWGTSHGRVFLWNVNDGSLVSDFRIDKILDVNTIAFSHDSQLLAAGTFDGKIYVWSMSNGVLLWQSEAHKEKVNSVVFSPDGKLLASASDDWTVRLWQVSNGILVRTLEGHTCQIYSVAFSPYMEFIVTGGLDRKIILWDVKSNFSQVNTFVGHKWIVNKVAFSPNGKFLASASEDGDVLIWDFKTGAILYKLDGYMGSVYSINFSPDSKLLFSGDRSLRLWHLENGNEVHRENGTGFINKVTSSTSGDRIISWSGGSGLLFLWSLKDCALTLIQKIEVPPLIRANGDIIFSRDLLAVADSREVDILHFSNQRIIKRLIGHEGPVSCVSFSIDGRFLASGSTDGTVCLWQCLDWALLHKRKGYTTWVSSLAFSPNGMFLAAGLGDGIVCLHDVTDGSLFLTLSEVGYPSTRCISFSPKGDLLAANSGDIIRLWGIPNAQFFVLKGHRGDISTIAFSPDGALLASGSADGTVRLWGVPA